MPTVTYRSWTKQISTLPITKPLETDIWADIYFREIPVAIPQGAVIHCHLVKQFENPSLFPENIAWLREFFILEPDDTRTLITCGGNTNAFGQIGMNITRDGHYDSTQEDCFYITPRAFAANSKIGYAARAKSNYTGPTDHVNIWEKGCLTVRIETPDTYQAQINSLEARVTALETQ